MATTTTKEAWSILKGSISGSDKVIYVKLQTLCNELDQLLMKQDETIQVFFNRVTNIVNSKKYLETQRKTKKLIQKVLSSLLPKFDHIAAKKNLKTYLH